MYMIKKLLVLFVLIFIITGCTSNKLSEDVINARNNVLNEIGVTDDDSVIVKNKDENSPIYTRYEINGNEVTVYTYLFFSNKDDYDKECDALKSTKYDISKFDVAYVIKLKINKYLSQDDDTKGSLISKYSNDNNYEIVY